MNPARSRALLDEFDDFMRSGVYISAKSKAILLAQFKEGKEKLRAPGITLELAAGENWDKSEAGIREMAKLRSEQNFPKVSGPVFGL